MAFYRKTRVYGAATGAFLRRARLNKAIALCPWEEKNAAHTYV